MADPTNPIDVEQSLAAFKAAYPNEYVTLKQNVAAVGPKPISAVVTERRHTAELRNRDENLLLELVDKYTAIKHSDTTADATPKNLGACGTVPDGGILYVECKVWGKYAARDLVYVRIEARLERNGATVTLYTDSSVTQYSTGGTLTTATAALVIDGNDLDLVVTGEAATAITWRAYSMKREEAFV